MFEDLPLKADEETFACITPLKSSSPLNRTYSGHRAGLSLIVANLTRVHLGGKPERDDIVSCAEEMSCEMVTSINIFASPPRYRYKGNKP
jgi:hypothetical protein